MSKILVFGHQNPDSDAIGSSVAYAYLKRELGVDAEAVALGTGQVLTYIGKLDSKNINGEISLID